ncbi:MAG: sel1 repeat family protein [Gammaproteobacteria bacterium]|nr:sel1 repeat family protein [Gammaproteobacteria bacterium]
MNALLMRYVFLLLISGFAVIAKADNVFLQGVTAYKNKDFLTAGRLFKQLAQQGQVDAQRYLGQMYDKGLGVPKNYDKAVTWYKQAAAQNDPAAQYHLGLKYDIGQGVPEDDMQAYIWFATAFNNGFEAAAAPLRILNKTMSTKDRQLALKQVAERTEQ